MGNGFVIKMPNGELLYFTFASVYDRAVDNFCHPCDWAGWLDKGYSVAKVSVIETEKLQKKSYLRVLEQIFQAK